MTRSSLRYLLSGTLAVLTAGGIYWSIDRPAPPPTAPSTSEARTVAEPHIASRAEEPATPRVWTAGAPSASRTRPLPPEKVPEAFPSRLLFAASWKREPVPALAAFNRWADKYAAASLLDRPDLISEGVQLAQTRRGILGDLIKSDPRQAIASTVPMAVRAQLPAAVLAQLETRVGGEGKLGLLGGQPVTPQDAPVPYHRVAVVGESEYQAFVYGRRTRQATKENISVQGVALDRSLAVSESPIRALEQGETVPAGVAVSPNCPVSGVATGGVVATAAAAAAPIAAQVGNKLETFCHIEHEEQFEAQLIAAEQSDDEKASDEAAERTVLRDGAPGTSGVTGRPSVAWSTGTKRVLIIRVDFADLTGSPKMASSPKATIDQAFVSSLFNNPNGVNDFYKAGSYNLTNLSLSTADVTGVLRLPNTATYYATNDLNYSLHTDAENAAKAAGFVLTNYDRIGVVFSYLGDISGSTINYAGLGELQGKNFWINGYFDFRAVAHELGHTFGLQHCNLWQVTDGNPVSDSGSSTEYGDPFGVMGSANTDINFQFDPWQKSILHWLPDSSIPTITDPGTYRVYRFDHANANTVNNPMALKIVRNTTQDYWISFRQLFPGRSTIFNGAYVIWGYNRNIQGNLLDMTTPGNSNLDAGLPIGQIFVDPVTGISLRPVAKGGSSPNEYLDLEISFRPFVEWASLVFATDQQSGNVPVTVVRSGDVSKALAVNYATSDGTATSPAVYTASSGTVNWAAGDAAPKTINIPVATAPAITAAVNFTVKLSLAGASAKLGNDTATVTIGTSGLVDVGLATNSLSANLNKVVRQLDGKLLVAGNFSSKQYNGVVAWGGGYTRLNTDGTLDDTFFNGPGANVTPTRALALQADGKILVGGNFTSINGTPATGVARLKANGTIDDTFAVGLGPDNAVRAIAVQPDGKIVIGGDFTTVNGVAREYVARLNPDGTLDTTFTPPDFANLTGSRVNTLVIQPNGRILIGGSFSFGTQPSRGSIARLNTNGTQDTSFNPGTGAHKAGDPTTLLEVSAIALQTDGSMVLGGTFTAYNGAARNYLARVSATGAIDAAYNPNVGAPVSSLLLQPDGKLLVGGSFVTVNGSGANRIARLNSNGTLDPTFRSIVGAPTPVYDMALQDDGKVVAALGYVAGKPSTLARYFTGLINQMSTVQLRGVTASGAEGSSVTLTASRTGSTVGAVSVNYGVQGLTAPASRFSPIAGTLAWADGDVSDRTIVLPLLNDGTFEPMQTAAVNLGAYNSGTLMGAPAQAVVSIASDAPDNSGPALSISAPLAGAVFSTSKISINGTASDAGLGDNGISSVTVNGITATGGAAAGAATANWSAKVTLVGGVNVLTVIASDSAGQSTTKTVSVSYFGPPSIATQPASVSVLPDSTATLSVNVSDSGVTDPTVNYQWYLGQSGDLSTPVGMDLPGFTTPTLASSTSFWVQVTNTSHTSTNSATATVTVALPPGVQDQPTAGTISTGSSTNLTVNAGASGAAEATITYQWYVGTRGDTSAPIAGATSNSLNTGPLTATTSFWVRLTNSAGFTVDSETVVVTVNQAPTIATQPQSVKIPTGTSTTLSVAVSASGTADPTLTYQWYQGATGLRTTPVASTTTSFTTPNLSTNTAYWVSIANSAGLVTESDTAVVAFNTTPTIGTQPASKLVQSGSITTLTVQVTASGTDDPAVTYQWYEGPVGTTTTPVGTDDFTFTTPALTATTTYWVTVTNSVNFAANSQGATITVARTPIIANQPVGGTITPNTKQVLSVSVSESGTTASTLTYQWYQGASGDQSRPLGANQPTYLTAPLTQNTSYWVKVTNSLQLTTRSGTAMVKVTPTALPNLTPLAANKLWSDAIVVSRNPHATSDDPAFYSALPLYVSTTYKNIGPGVAKVAFLGSLTLAPTGRVIAFAQAPMAAGAIGAQAAKPTLALGRLPAGEYTLTLKLDTDNRVAETNEADNAYTKRFTVVDLAPARAGTPLVPHGVASTVNGHSGVTLFWTPGDPRPGTFSLLRRAYVNRKWGALAPVTGTTATNSFRDESVTPGMIYQYFVQETVPGSALASAYGASAAIVVPATPALRALPNLEFVADSLVLSSVTDAAQDGALTDVADVLANVSVTNTGNASTALTGFGLTLNVDGMKFSKRSTDFGGAKAVAAGTTVAFKNVDLGHLPIGAHSVTVQIDPLHQVDESDETAKTTTKSFSVTATKPDLAGQAGGVQTTAVVLNSVKGATADATGLYTTDTIYASVAIANLGVDAPATTNFAVSFFLDGVATPLLPVQGIMPGLDDTWVLQDLPLGPLALGPHTLSVRIDSENNVDEANKGDNLLTKQFIVKRPAR